MQGIPPTTFGALEQHISRDVGRNTAQVAAAAADGPPGAVILGELLERSGIPSILVTDTLCAPPVQAAASGTSLPVRVVGPDDVDDLAADLAAASVTDVIFVERPGPAVDGEVYDMRAARITEFVAPLHLLAVRGPWQTIGIGDGGNEIGMGNVPADVVTSSVDQGAVVRCAIGCDALVFGGVSNWAAIALGAAVASVLRPDEDLSPGALVERHAEVLRRAVEAGAIDGVTRQSTCTVDGLEALEHTIVLEGITAELERVRRRRSAAAT